jgi:hypothetical protein
VKNDSLKFYATSHQKMNDQRNVVSDIKIDGELYANEEKSFHVSSLIERLIFPIEIFSLFVASCNECNLQLLETYVVGVSVDHFRALTRFHYIKKLHLTLR